MLKKEHMALFISVFSVSFAAILIVSCNAPSLSIAFYRMLFTTIILLPLILFRKKYLKEIKTLPSKTIKIMIGIGVILATHFALWITSLDLTSVASSVILVTAHPILVGPVSHFFFKEKLSLLNTIGICISLTGVIVLVYGNYGFTDLGVDSLEGNILAILGGVAAGLYILGGRKIRKTVSAPSYAFVVYSISTVVLFFVLIAYSLLSDASFFVINTRDIWIIFIMAVVAGIFGHTLYNWSLKYIRASLASVALLGEPIGSALFAFVLPWIQQIPSRYTLIGGSFIMFGIYLNTRRNQE